MQARPGYLGRPAGHFGFQAAPVLVGILQTSGFFGVLCWVLTLQTSGFAPLEEGLVGEGPAGPIKKPGCACISQPAPCKGAAAAGRGG